MRKTYPALAVRSAVTSALSNQFTRNLMISILMTGFDSTVLITAGCNVLDAFNEASWLAAAFGLAAAGMLVTLGRIWLLTFRNARAD
jgi:type IV secretory pathway TrbD component